MPALEDLLKLKDEVSKLQTQKDSLEGLIESRKLEADRVAREARDQATQIVQEAKEYAAGKQATFDQRERAITQREADVTIREQGVAWVDATTHALNDRAEALMQAEQLAEQARADARAQQQYWVSKLDELKAREEALTLREAIPMPVDVVPASNMPPGV